MGIIKKVAVLGAAGAAVKYFGDFKQGPQRRQKTFGALNGVVGKTGLDGIFNKQLTTLMERLSISGK